MKPHRMKSFWRIRRQNVGGQSEIRPWMRDVAALCGALCPECFTQY